MPVGGEGVAMAGVGAPRSYQLALALAREEFRRGSPEEWQRRCARSGSRYLLPGEGGPAAQLSYLGRPYLIAWPGGEVRPEAPVWLQIILLHYLNGARGAGPADELIPFRELEGGQVYDVNFRKRVRDRLVRGFASCSELLLQVGKLLGGEEVAYGDAAVKIWALPRVPLTVVIWRGDEEFPADANVLFDASVSSYLCTEDVVVLCEQVASELVGLAKEMSRRA